MKSVMKHQFSQVPRADIPRSSFDRTHGHKSTFNSGFLIPFYCDEALPGDTFKLKATAFSRLATPINPFMDNLRMDTQFFAVPVRLVWDNWQRFNGEQTNPGDSTDYLVPTITSPAGGYDYESVFDYMGIPPGVENLEHSALWNRAINLIWNEWYRDQNIQDSLPVPKDDGPDDPADYTLLRRGKRHDYFTSGLPWPQKGDSVDLPLGTSAPLVDTGDLLFTSDGGGTSPIQRTNDADRYVFEGSDSIPALTNFRYESGMEADLSEATAATINQLRQAFQIQKMLERDARGGTRYTELIKAHFGVTSPDARLQRPEYLGGGSTMININPVAQTSETDPSGPDASPQGNLAAFGTAIVTNNGFTKSFTEHCILVGFVSVRADLTYQQGLNRMFSRQTRYDFYWPALSHIGEQAIKNKEIFAQGTAVDEETFAFQERYAEYRYKPSIITGKFRSSFPQTLDNWHLSQEFETLPTLSPEFIEENPPVERVIAVQDEPQFIFDSHIQMKCARPMPLFGVPGLIDHF